MTMFGLLRVGFFTVLLALMVTVDSFLRYEGVYKASCFTKRLFEAVKSPSMKVQVYHRNTSS